MGSCITEDYKGILTNALTAEMSKEVLLGIITSIPLCKDVSPTKVEVEETKARKVPEVWGIEPVYIDEKGKKITFSSPSALLKHLDLPLSGIQCDAEGKKCRATSVVEILRVHGYTVTGNGEPKKAAEGGKKMTVIHPKSVKEE